MREIRGCVSYAVTQFWNVPLPPELSSWVYEVPDGATADGRKHKKQTKKRAAMVADAIEALSEAAWALDRDQSDIYAGLKRMFGG